METQEKWRSEALSHSPPPVSVHPAAPSYLMGTPDCLMCVTVVQRTPHPAVLIWSNHGPTAAFSRWSASCHLRGKRSIQVTSQLARQVTHDYLYCPKQTWPLRHSAHFRLSACFQSTPSHGAGCCSWVWIQFLWCCWEAHLWLSTFLLENGC